MVEQQSALMEQTTGKIFQDLSTNTNFLAKEELALLDEIIQMLANEQHIQSQIDKLPFQQQRDAILAKQTEILEQQKLSRSLVVVGGVLSLLVAILLYRQYKQGKLSTIKFPPLT